MKIPNLRRYYARIYDTLQSRRDCDVEELVFEEFERENSAIIEGRIRFWDESILYLSETFMVRGVTLARTRYVTNTRTDRNVCFSATTIRPTIRKLGPFLITSIS